MKPQYYTWEERGKTYTQITPVTKRVILAEYAIRYGLKTFVETGTCEGDTLAVLHGLFDHCFSIELDDDRYKKARERIERLKNVTFLNGDSGDLIPHVLSALRNPTLFWLDAHGENWVGPIVQELEAIFATEVKGAILIDDMDFITDTLPENPHWKKSEEYGIVRLVHEALA